MLEKNTDWDEIEDRKSDEQKYYEKHHGKKIPICLKLSAGNSNVVRCLGEKCPEYLYRITGDNKCLKHQLEIITK